MSTIRVDNFAPSAGGTAFGSEGIAKAWHSVSLNGSSSDSYNISSETDNGTGDTSFDLTNSFSSVDDMSRIANTDFDSLGFSRFAHAVLVDASSYRVEAFTTSGAATDTATSCIVMGDLA